LPGVKGEIEMIGYDGPVLAFVEARTRLATEPGQPKLEEAVDCYKRDNLVPMAQQFFPVRRIESASCRFDVMAIETRPGARPEVRLQEGAFSFGSG
jgi:Holliday junction resolvase-like predicted endonuclease